MIVYFFYINIFNINITIGNQNMKEDWSGTGSFFLSTWLIRKISFKKNYDSDADILCHNASLHGVALHCIASPLFISTNWITQYKWSWLTLGTGIIYIGRTDEILKKWLRFCCCVCNRDTKNTRLEFLMKPTNLHWWRRRWRLFGGGRGGAILSLVFLPWHSLSYWPFQTTLVVFRLGACAIVNMCA